MLGTDDYRTQKVHVAPRGGKYRIVPDGMFYKIKSEAGGVLPKQFNTSFTSLKSAESVLERYFNDHPARVARDEKYSKSTLNKTEE